MHPHYPQEELVSFCRQHNIHVQAYSSLGMSAFIVADPDPVPFWPLDPGSGKGRKSRSGSGIPIGDENLGSYHLEFRNIFGLKYFQDPQHCPHSPYCLDQSYGCGSGFWSVLYLSYLTETKHKIIIEFPPVFSSNHGKMFGYYMLTFN